VMALVASGYFLCGLPVLLQRLNFLFQLQQSDAINVERALILLRGDSLYLDISKGGPFLYTAYPPLFYWLEAPLIKLCSNLWFPGRFLAFVGYLGCGFLMMGWGWKRWGAVPALLLGSLFLCFPSWARWGTMVRPDTLYLFVNFVAFLLLYRFTENSKMKWLLFAAGILNGSALLLKQSAYSLVGTYGIYSLAKKRWKDFAIFFLTAMAVVLPVCVFENNQSHGLFYDHTVRWLNTGYQWKTLWYWLSNDFLREVGCLALLVLIVCFFKKTSLLLSVQILISIFNLMSLGRGGGAENYWLEFVLYGMFFVGECYFFSDFRPWVSEKIRAGFSWVFILLMLAGLLMNFRGQWPDLPTNDSVLTKKEALTIYTLPGEHLALDSDLPLMAGKKIWIQPYEYTAMVHQGFWAEEPLLQEIRSKKFATIELYDIPEQYLLPPTVVREIQKDYHVGIRKFGRVWYLPNLN